MNADRTGEGTRCCWCGVCMRMMMVVSAISPFFSIVSSLKVRRMYECVAV